MSDSKTLCSIPWVQRYTNEQGLQMMCCVGDGEANILRDEVGKPLHISQGLTDEQVLNSADLRAIRLAMMRGEWPDACERCRRSEEAGATSNRHHMNTRFGKWMAESLSETREDGSLDHPKVRYADIRLGNVCNLTCRMCGPQASRLWADQYNAVQPPSHILPVTYLSGLRDNNWVKRQPVQWLIEQSLPTVEALHFAGGEPLIIPEMLQALDMCIQSGRANEIALSYNTNITVLPEKVTRLWPHFRSVSILCSVDGFGKVNDYIRRPSKWSDIDRNLHKLDDHFDEWKLKQVTCSATVQIYNVLQLAELYDYLATGFKHIRPIPQLAPLYHPNYLSIQILPERAKAVARERLLAVRDKAKGWLNSRFESTLSSIDTVIDFLGGTANPKIIMDFLYFSEKSDRQFGDSWRQACPDLARLLGRQDPS